MTDEQIMNTTETKKITMDTTLSIQLAHYAKNEFGLFTITYKDKWSWALLNVAINEDYSSVAWFTFVITNK